MRADPCDQPLDERIAGRDKCQPVDHDKCEAHDEKRPDGRIEEPPEKQVTSDHEGESEDGGEGAGKLEAAETYREEINDLKERAEMNHLARINEILEQARQDGTLAAISIKYFGLDLTRPD